MFIRFAYSMGGRNSAVERRFLDFKSFTSRLRITTSFFKSRTILRRTSSVVVVGVSLSSIAFWLIVRIEERWM